MAASHADPARTYTADEERRLYDNLLRLTDSVYCGGFRERAASVALLQEFHERLFSGVRDHAGKCRSGEFGSEILTFGPNRSVHRSTSPADLEGILIDVRRSLASLVDNASAPDYEVAAIRMAVWAHAEVIRVHPFEDGNGRTSRLLMNWLLLRAGLRPIAMEIPKQEYRDCLNHYFRTKEMQPLIDLVLGIYPLG